MDKWIIENYLAYLIIKRGFTFKQFAFELKMTEEKLIAELKNKQSDFSFKQIYKICELLNMEFEQIFKPSERLNG